MTADELKDICLCGETTKVQFKEAPIPQKELAKEISPNWYKSRNKYVNKRLI